MDNVGWNVFGLLVVLPVVIVFIVFLGSRFRAKRQRRHHTMPGRFWLHGETHIKRL